MRQTGTLEAKPGIPPSVSHLEALLASTRESNVRAILRTPYDDTDPAEWLSSRAGVPVVELPATVDREAPPGALAAYFDDVLSRLEKAIEQR